LRVPSDLIATVDRFAEELKISRNDSLLRLAARGAGLYEREQRIEQIREQRWAAVLAAQPEVDVSAGVPSADEQYEAIMRAREMLFDLPSE
jgi:hypothetical protein